LDSLVIQTFQDFEVIIVDDCSTDSSCEIVKSYMPKFNGRLRIEKTETNSGHPCVPRNIGMMLARGEYIQFIDNDDMLLGNALETLYKAAILYDADIVYTSSHYNLNAPNDIYLHKDGASKKLFDTQKEFTLDDPRTNLNRLIFEPGEGNFRNPWTKFVRRDFLIKNKIFFPNLFLSEDFIWVINMYCHAKRFLRISTPLYFYRRYNYDSITLKFRPPQEQCRFWFSAFVEFIKAFHELERKNELLAENPLYSFIAFKDNFNWHLNRTQDARKELGNERSFTKFCKMSSLKNFLIPQRGSCRSSLALSMKKHLTTNTSSHLINSVLISPLEYLSS
ncbi:MAG: glycosyltransferase, partial [Selenomonadaceae bacterium]|nr:glycosyltransferase [Selenomonadaceae bacterium]